MKMRDAKAEDTSRLDALLSKLICDESQYDGNLNQECEVKDNYCGRIGLDGHKLLLIEDNEEVVGYLYGFIYHIPGIYKAPIAIIDALFVEEAHRRKGYASMLISEFKKFAGENGVCRIELKVMSDNMPALSLYEKLSFSETKKYMKMEL